MKLTIEEIANKFLPEQTIQSIEPLGHGLINQTFLVTSAENKRLKNIVLQKINGKVYPDPRILVKNHVALSSKLTIAQNEEKNIISHLIESIEGKYFFQNHNDYWRALFYTEGTVSYDEVLNKQVAYQGASIVGRFNNTFSLYENIKLIDPIEGFHNLRHYSDLFEKARYQNTENRLNKCKEEINFIDRHKKQMIELFKNAQQLPNRICHYDTKINNILFDKKTNKAVQIVDLDNMMHGKVIFDFGDMMRSFISPADENEKDLSKVKIRWEIVKSIVSGYLLETSSMLTKEEKSMLISGGILITYEQAIRFLTDYMVGDQYYKTVYPDHNLVRTKNQIHLTKLFLNNRERLESIVLEN